MSQTKVPGLQPRTVTPHQHNEAASSCSAPRAVPSHKPSPANSPQLDRVVLICGRYEGVDERINQLYCDMELSIGDYVLSGGELAAAVVIDATIRLIPGVLGNEASSEFESFGVADAEIDTDVEGVPRSQHGAGGLLDYPHYTRPAEFGGLRVPEVLLNGDHHANPPLAPRAAVAQNPSQPS